MNYSAQTPEAQERTDKALRIVEEIRTRFAAGASFAKPKMAEDYAGIRDRLKSYQHRTIVSPKTLKYLQDMNRAVKGKKI